MGAHASEGGVNFAIFSRHASRVRLELYDRPEDATPARAIDLDPRRNRTGDVWHVWIAGLRSGQLYGYRVDGPYEPRAGHRFNFNRLLLDPFATAVAKVPHWDFDAARGYDASAPQTDLVPSAADNAGTTPKCVFTHDDFDWGDDQPLRHPWPATVIYETHVRGFTIHASSGVKHPGTYRGAIEKIPYLKALGVTAVELMPVHEFNERHVIGIDLQTGTPLRKYCGATIPWLSWRLKRPTAVRAISVSRSSRHRGRDGGCRHRVDTQASNQEFPADVADLARRADVAGGDEFRRTQRGNDNAYCQDNETSWYDWNCIERHAEFIVSSEE
jgi:pullulanase/glycogen debranching enzyme